MSILREYITGVKGAIAIITAIVVVTAFAVSGNLTALGAEADNKTQDAKIEKIEASIHELDKNMALMAQAAKTQSQSVARQEQAIAKQADDIREVKQLLMEIARKQ